MIFRLVITAVFMAILSGCSIGQEVFGDGEGKEQFIHLDTIPDVGHRRQMRMKDKATAQYKEEILDSGGRKNNRGAVGPDDQQCAGEGYSTDLLPENALIKVP